MSAAFAFPKFNPEAIAVALFKQLLTANGQGSGQFLFNSYDRKGALPQNVPPSNQPYMGLVELGMQQALDNRAQGLEKWLMHFKVLVYIRADAIPGNTPPATVANAAILAIVNAMRSGPTYSQQKLGGLVDNAWIEGDILIDTGIIDQQMAILIPIVVDLGV